MQKFIRPFIIHSATIRRLIVAVFALFNKAKRLVYTRLTQVWLLHFCILSLLRFCSLRLVIFLFVFTALEKIVTGHDVHPDLFLQAFAAFAGETPALASCIAVRTKSLGILLNR